ncbi:transcriptional regulator with XRE-family HTH domain [Amycolatopsis lexingtonensis]|uniref:Transcriptional regulator with XRE-family HTH domain n=1 Tax=Amycolatopsis lexingtonensis TaxID=218822 RepID=A0ABR9HQQ4_9PSEU|nr:helix-turn-helix transcriptional regulator [Amycolatopsis lexingtonensis]MBE1493254.1 transcriptional regulator with XRE-family HTH domain [Amycolatopsis lexingtonensis]
MSTTSGAGLGAMIRTWRDRLPPSAAALPVGRNRRTAGLRREELADLAGLSVDYVVRLEQGRAITPSVQVVASLARALQLSGPERDHLYRLAGLTPPADGTISDHIPPGVHRVLSRLGDVAVAVFAADWQLVWWNRSWAALLGDPSAAEPRLRNFARDRFPLGSGPARLAQWPVTELDAETTDLAVVADLRRATGRFPRDARLAGLIRELTAGNRRFARLWATGAVGGHREDEKTIHHPSVGPVEVNCDVLGDGDTELKIVIMTAVPGSTAETKLQLAAAGGQPARSPSSAMSASAAGADEAGF